MNSWWMHEWIWKAVNRAVNRVVWWIEQWIWHWIEQWIWHWIEQWIDQWIEWWIERWIERWKKQCKQRLLYCPAPTSDQISYLVRSWLGNFFVQRQLGDLNWLTGNLDLESSFLSSAKEGFNFFLKMVDLDDLEPLPNAKLILRSSLLQSWDWKFLTFWNVKLTSAWDELPRADYPRVDCNKKERRQNS